MISNKVQLLQTSSETLCSLLLLSSGRAFHCVLESHHLRLDPKSKDLTIILLEEVRENVDSLCVPLILQKHDTEDEF